MSDTTERRRLSPKAYEEIPGDEYDPYIGPDQLPAEFTIRPVLLGILFGIMFGAANAYLGLRVGLTVSTSIPIAVMTVAVFRIFFGGRSTILEHNISQTVGSASSSQASGLIFTIPALFLWGFSPGVTKLLVIALAGGLLGVLFMIPLRRFLIKNEHGALPYPEGTACAEVLVAADAGGTHARPVFLGLGLGMAYTWLMKGLNLWPRDLWVSLGRVIPKAQVGVDVAPALISVGYILGPRIGLVMVGGSAIAWLILIPIIEVIGRGLTAPLYPETVQLIVDMDPETIWTRYIRYVGAGAVATAGIATLIRSTPMIIASFKEGMRGLRSRMEAAQAVIAERTDDDLPLNFVLIGVGAIVLFLVAVPHVFGFVESVAVRVMGALLVAIFAFFFVTVSSRIVGLVGVTSNPTSGMTIAALLGTSLIFGALGWTDDTGRIAALSIGAVVAISASIAGDTSQDLKTGFLLGATPKRQQVGELIGVLTAAFFVCASILALEGAYGFGSTELPAPQANMMMLVIDGVLQAEIPWRFVLVGVGLALVAEAFRLPSLAFAVGVYLPITTMMPIFIGGMIRKLLEDRQPDAEARSRVRERGVLFSSGLIGGDGLMGVGIAFWAGVFGIPEGFGHAWLGPFAPVLSLIMFAVLAYLIVQQARQRQGR
ncbi:MAG: oligopeptide transporter, OPT family [Gemmatimonadetes bacterium]|uniref:Oligopeptide transporter, OPT family n=1 Tax=Candidatus Kutchimonas denitrificans TaxID=3056748 RepID=A0AAE4Z9D9_9BACT|nr:oligopeptide transporter, OPT family [Gemmatimonadota bacterium]NIR74917.1 oligopeptide transporter, OPT family [Candidatus Kutchimonas denitrificans]NIS00029.1 oligopeptide transporter, OPT family [Gemmatimonadota bacterium]NIT65612.1 oligopeptide transporter, OPT family [Gemmatimonadota bacterium]NIU52582.1 oligopeptide transporter, OPT family [Gemmatimonadota bacterium]